MKTSLLLTTALVATVATTNAFANPTIVTDSSYFNEGNDPHIAIKGELSLVKEGMDEGGLTTYPIQYTIKAGHTVDLDTTGKYGKFDDSRLDWVNENVKMTGGTVNIIGGDGKQHEPGLHGNGVNISGGTINITNGSVFDDSEAGASGFTMTDGTIKMNAKGSFIGSSQGGNVNISGGTIEVNGGSSLDKPNIAGANVIIGATNLSGGNLNIKDNSNLIVISKDSQIQENGDITADGNINLTNKGVIDLSGTLLSDVKGDGTLNFNNSNAKVDGLVEGSKVAFNNGIYDLDKAIRDRTLVKYSNENPDTGEVENFEFENLQLDSLNIAKDATVNMKNEDIFTRLESADSLVINGKLNMDNSDVEACDIKIENATIISKTSPDVEIDDNHGIWGGRNTVVKNSIVTLDNSYLSSNNLTINGSTIVAKNGSELENHACTEQAKMTITDSNINLSDRSSILAQASDGKYNIVGGDLDITSSKIDAEGGSEIGLGHNADMNIAGNSIINMDYRNVKAENAHDGGILHEGQSGDININGGQINLAGDVAKIERGGYDSDWVYAKDGTPLMYIEEFWKKAGTDISQATDEQIKNAGLDPQNVDRSYYHVSEGNININGGQIALSDGARISTTAKNTGDINISGGTVKAIKNKVYINTDGEVKVSGTGILDVADGAILSANSLSQNSANKAISVIETGKIDLSGTLIANVSGNGNLNINSSNAKVDGNVEGTNVAFNANHSMSQAFGGTVDGLNTLSVNKGTFTYDKKATNLNKVDIKDNAILNIGNKTLSAKNVNFERNSTLALQVSNMDQYGKISADTINVSNENTTMKVTVDNGVIKNDETKTFDFLAGNVTGDFTNKIADNSRYTIKKNQDNLFEITGSATANDVAKDAGGSANNTGTAEAWDTVSSSSNVSQTAKDVADSLNKLSQEATTAEGKKAYIDALTALAPETSPQVQQTQNEVTSQIFDVVGQHLSGSITYNDKQGASSGDSVSDKGTMWVQTIMNKSELDDNRDIKGFDSESSGIAFGFDKKINDETKVGIGYGYTNTEVDGYFRDTDIDTHTAIVYGEYKPSNWYVNATASYGWSDYSEDKNVAGNNVKADYDVETFGLQTMAGIEMALDKAIVTPEIGLRYIHIAQEAYRDSSDQSVTSNDSDILTGVIGTKVSSTYEMENGMTLTPEAKLAMTYDMTNDKSGSTVTLANGSAYNVSGEALDRFGIEVGAGLKTEYNDNIELSIGYEGKYRDDYENHTGILNAKYKF